MTLHKQHYLCIKQHDTTDCGPACLAIIAKQYGLDLSLAKIRSLAGTDRQGTSLFSLAKTAEKLGFKATGVKGDKEAFLAGFPTPAIAHVVVDDNLLHYIVVEEVNEQKLSFPILQKESLLIRQKIFSISGRAPCFFFNQINSFRKVIFLLLPSNFFSS